MKIKRYESGAVLLRLEDGPDPLVVLHIDRSKKVERSRDLVKRTGRSVHAVALQAAGECRRLGLLEASRRTLASAVEWRKREDVPEMAELP